MWVCHYLLTAGPMVRPVLQPSGLWTGTAPGAGGSILHTLPCGFHRPLLEYASLQGPHALVDSTLAPAET